LQRCFAGSGGEAQGVYIGGGAGGGDWLRLRSANWWGVGACYTHYNHTHGNCEGCPYKRIILPFNASDCVATLRNFLSSYLILGEFYE